MESHESTYYSFLLRLWRVADEGQPVWYASLEEAVSGERRNFSRLDDLFTFLRTLCGPAAEDEANAHSPPAASPIPRQPLDHPQPPSTQTSEDYLSGVMQLPVE